MAVDDWRRSRRESPSPIMVIWSAIDVIKRPNHITPRAKKTAAQMGRLLGFYFLLVLAITGSELHADTTKWETSVQ